MASSLSRLAALQSQKGDFEAADSLFRDSLQMSRRIWGDDSYHAGRSMDVFVSRLRKHLAGDPAVEIRTVHGKGLRLIVGG